MSLNADLPHLYRRQQGNFTGGFVGAGGGGTTTTVSVVGSFYQPFMVCGQLPASPAFNTIYSPNANPVIDYMIYVLGHEVSWN
jgi:hypothetical protein